MDHHVKVVGVAKPFHPFSALNRDSFIVHFNSSGAGQNVVAIDNKIEQAMDLVKTHLMYAVREEIENLRSKITDLEKKVGRLEGENSALRAAVGPEVAASLIASVPSSQPPPPSH